MKKVALILVFTICVVSILSFSEKVVVSKKIVLKEDEVMVEHNVVSEQTQLIQSLKEEVDELYDTTYKLNRLLIKKQGDQDVRHTSTRATRSRQSHRRGNEHYFTTSTER